MVTRVADRPWLTPQNRITLYDPRFRRKLCPQSGDPRLVAGTVRIAPMKILKYALYALGGLVVLVIAAVVIITATFDPNQYKPQIIKAVKDKTGRTLAIDGDIKLKLFPKIGAQVGKVTLSERSSEKIFAGCRRLRCSLR
jgi:hypothetical protein